MFCSKETNIYTVERGEKKSNAVKGAISYTQINQKILMQQNRGFIDENKVGTVVKSYEQIFSGKMCLTFFLVMYGGVQDKKIFHP